MTTTTARGKERQQTVEVEQRHTETGLFFFFLVHLMLIPSQPGLLYCLPFPYVDDRSNCDVMASE